MSTLKEVAEQANVSISTVSRVLNDLPGVSAPTRSRVLEAARRLGYTANMSARGLSTDRTYNVGIISYRRPPQVMMGTVSIGHVGMEEGLAESGYHAISMRVDQEMMQDNRGLSMVHEKRVDGLILIGPELETRYVLQLVSTGIPIVLFDNMLEETPVNCVLSDNARGAYQVTRHLLTVHGYKQTVFLSGPPKWLSSRERYEGYCLAAAEAGVEPHRIVMADTTVDTGQEAMRTALETIPDLTAVVAVNDATAWGAGRACKEAGLSIPGDIAIVGYDNVEIARLHEPPLTTVNMQMQEMGWHAARRLVEIIENGATPALCIRMAPEIIVRESCGAH